MLSTLHRSCPKPRDALKRYRSFSEPCWSPKARIPRSLLPCLTPPALLTQELNLLSFTYLASSQPGFRRALALPLSSHSLLKGASDGDFIAECMWSEVRHILLVSQFVFLAARISSRSSTASFISFSSLRRLRSSRHCVVLVGRTYFAFFSSYNLFFSPRVRQGVPLPLTPHSPLKGASDRGFIVLYLWSKIIRILPSLLCHNLLSSPRFRHAVPLPLISHSPLRGAPNRGLLVEYLRSEARCILLILKSAFLALISSRSFSASHILISS